MKVTHDSRQALSRARFFLAKASACPAEARVEHEACLEAAIVFARAAVHRVQAKYKGHTGWNAWWDSLRADPAVDFFRTERDWILKEAPPKLCQKICVASIGDSEAAYVPQTAAEFYYFDDPSTPATATVEKHLKSLEATLADAAKRFSP